MEQPEDDAPLADESGPVPADMPLEPTEDAPRPERSEEQEPKPRPDRE